MRVRGKRQKRHHVYPKIGFLKKLKRKNRKMREIVIPKLLTVKLPSLNLETGKHNTYEASFADFLNDNILHDKKFLGEATIKDLRRANRVYGKFENAKPGDSICVDETDWELMRDVGEKPTGGWNPFFGPQFLPHIEAVLSATVIPDPKKETKDDDTTPVDPGQ